jgi:hypothetical protein
MKSEINIERINGFVALQTPQIINQRLIMYAFLNTVFLFFLAGTILTLNMNFFSSGLAYFLPVSIILSCWALWLQSRKNIPQKQISYNLYISVATTFYSILFYFLAFLYAVESRGIVVLVGLTSEIALLFFLTWYRVQLYTGRKEIRSGNPNYRIIGIGVPIAMFVFWGTAKFIESNLLGPLLFVLLGLIYSIGLSFLGNYFVAKKYREYLIFYDSPKKKSSNKN